ncbi:DMT family transporter [Alteriqipengyuania lutimaris]|uniref:EamA/RhaT family transporter n=1 Tax=Alteriqipengyuania lutimaris TaxID=1538146 RepID=A0A395LH58_9SPHN|nr:EamA family transporter [Alteriqipengyuania lutimaris]MBB3035354.1 O-acetylserine/cysteine efflux transporter [Alteriqipengyuania lutimaris]RDS75939.1 EamA/RhaT family transporter [Alteriqipengyuania lutimaris]
MPAWSIGLMVLCNLAWALNVIVGKLAVDDLAMPPLFFAGLRSAIVVLVLVPLLVRSIPPRLPAVLAVGLAISGGSFALLFMGLQTADPATAGAIGLVGAPMTVLFAIVFLGETVRWRRALGMVLAFGGVLLAILSKGAMAASGGAMLVFVSALVGALGAVFVKRLDMPAMTLQAWAAVASTMVLLPLSFAVEQGQVASFAAAPWALAGCLVFAALVVSIAATGTYFVLFQKFEANLVVPLTLLHPLMTIGLGAWLTNDVVGGRLLLGSGIALAGVAIIVIRPSETFSRRFLTRPRM